MFDYCGAIHIHSSYSFDGLRSIDEIIASAQRCGLDFVVINDHASIESKKYEGWHGNVLLITGEEITPAKNHYLAFGINKPVVVPKNDSNPQAYIDEVNRLGGFGFIAHPDHIGNKKFRIKSYSWDNWDVKNFAGISIWDLQTDWQETLTNIPKAVLSFLFPVYFMTGPKKETMKRWDTMNKDTENIKYALGEVDNHEVIKTYFGVIKARIFPFDFAFKTIRTHIVFPEPLTKTGADVGKALAAIKNGFSYVSNDYFKNASGFRFYGKNRNIIAEIPGRGLIKIIKNGEEIFRSLSDHAEISGAGKGVYRCEVYLKKIKYYPWIFSNPVVVEG